MTPLLRDAVDVLIEPALAFARPDKRLYAPFLLSSAVLAALVWAMGARRRGVSLLRYLVPWRIFAHRSSRFDVRWFLVRAPLHALVTWPLRVSSVGVMLWTMGALREGLGTPATASVPRGAVIALFSVGWFAADDFTRYLLHRCMHRVPALWELHKVHHSAEVLTPLTLYRVHPVESALNQLRGVLTLGLVLGVVAWVFPGRLRAWEVLGVDALGFSWTFLGSNLRHSHVWLTWGPRLEHVFISPAQHQIHHGRDTSGTNFGAALALWDWLGGTLRVAAGARRPRSGLSRAERNHAPTVPSSVVAPVVSAARHLWPPRTPQATTDG